MKSKAEDLLKSDEGKVLDQIFSEALSFMTVFSVPEFRYLKSNSQHQKLIRAQNIIGKTILEVEPGLEAQGIIGILNEVVKTKKPFIGNEVPVFYDIENSEAKETKYLNFVYQPLCATDGSVYAILVQGHEVTEKVLARKELEQNRNAISNERDNFRNLFRQTPEMVCILLGPDHRFEFVNEAHIKTLGFDATGMTVRKAQPESVEVHGILDEVYRTGKTAELYEIPITVSDSLRYFNLTFSARRNEAREINGIMILGTEVTDVVKSRRLLAREAKLIESMPSPFFAVDENWTVIYWNPAATAVIGLKEKQVIGQVLWTIFPGIEDSQFGKTYKQAKSEQKILSFESYYEHYKKWYNVWAFPFEKGVAVTFLDISDRKPIEERLEKSEERYRLLFDNSPLPKYIVDFETLKFVDVNNAAIKHYGYSKEEFLSMKATEIRPDEEVPKFLDIMKLDFNPENKDQIQERRRHRKKNGEIIEVEMNVLDIVLDGKKSRIAAVVDVTERIKAENRQAELLKHLQETKEEAERANALKSAFLANMSHEIRTPLGAMMGFAELMRDPRLSKAEAENYLLVINRNGEQLLHIINDILDLSKVEAGQLLLEYLPTDPIQIIEEVLSLMRMKAREKHLALEFVQSTAFTRKCVSDPVRIRQVLLNLVSNAIKFTEFGRVQIRLFSGQTSAHEIAFEVSDTGIGLKEDQIDRIFEAFVQADGSVTRRFGGTGLGLSLSRKLAKALGGDVQVVSTAPNQGSTFRFSFKDLSESEGFGILDSSDRGSAHEDLISNQKPLQGTQVLVVDDSPDNRQLLWQFLTKAGAIVESVDNGIEAYKRATNGNHDIVLMDIQMPLMDGYTATQQLRKLGYKKPIIAISAHAMAEEKRKSKSAGCDDHLAKPINLKVLVNTILKYTSAHPA